MLKITLNEIDFLEYRKGQADTLEIYDIVVQSRRGIGIGTELIRQMLEKENPQRVYAFCRSTNKNAHRFYKKLGFKGYHLSDFYPDGDAKIFIYETSK
jgi:RimJ/RimL family protein N-acetyltransferase